MGQYNQVMMADSDGSPVLDKNNLPVWTKEYQFTRADGSCFKITALATTLAKAVWATKDHTSTLGHAPTIEKIDLFDITLKRDGKVFMASFDLIDQIPDRPPEKWKDFNRCRVGIHCAVVSELQIFVGTLGI